MKILSFVMGIVLIVAGLYGIFNPLQSITALTMILGIAMLISGIGSVLTYLGSRRMDGTTGWVLVEGLFTTVLAIIILANPLTGALALSVFFGMWLLMSGILRIVGSIELKRIGAPWVLLFLLGLITSLLGIYGFINPVFAGLALSLMISLFFLMQGVNALALGFAISKKY